MLVIYIMNFKVIIVLIVLLIIFLFLWKIPIKDGKISKQKFYINENNQAKLTYYYNIKNKKSVCSNSPHRSISDIFDEIVDKPITKPDEIQPFNLEGNVSLKHNIYVPPLDQYSVQSGLYDNNPSPKPQVFKPIGVEVKNRVDLDSKNSNKYIHEIYDGILNDKPITDKEIDSNQYKIIPAYKGYSLEMDNWNYYKNEDYVNGGAYQNLIGVENNKNATQRIIDGYNDFELKEWI